MDINHLKNRAKDLLNDLTEQREDPDGQRRAGDPADQRPAAADSDRPDEPGPAGESGSGQWREPGEASARSDEAADDRRMSDPAASSARTEAEPGAEDRTRSAEPDLAPARDVAAERPAAGGQPAGERDVVGERDLASDRGARERLVAGERDVASDRPVGEGGVAGERDVAAGRGTGDRDAVGERGAPDRSLGEPRRDDRGQAGDGADELPTDPERMVTRERAESYSRRWDEVKGEFVDAPREAVARADALVGELLDELGELFSQQRRSIEQELTRDEVSTEELRTALRRYRSFFDRLVSV